CDRVHLKEFAALPALGRGHWDDGFARRALGGERLGLRHSLPWLPHSEAIVVWSRLSELIGKTSTPWRTGRRHSDTAPEGKALACSAQFRHAAEIKGRAWASRATGRGSARRDRATPRASAARSRLAGTNPRPDRPWCLVPRPRPSARCVCCHPPPPPPRALSASRNCTGPLPTRP